MKKINRLISLLMLIFLCFLCSCSREGKATNEVKAEVDTNKDIMITSFFDKYTDNLDGAYTEKYAADLYIVYQSTDNLNFIRLLSQQEIKRIKPIANLLVSEVMNSSDTSIIKEFTTDIEKLLDTKDLNKREEYLVYEIYTNILYYKIVL